MEDAILGALSSHYQMGQLDKADDYARMLMSGVEQTSDSGARIRRLSILAMLALARDEPDRAMLMLDEALVLAREHANPAFLGPVLRQLGEACRYRGEHGRAMSAYEEGLALVRAEGDRFTEALVLGNLGLLATQMREWEDATNHFRACISISLEVRATWLLPAPTLGLACTYWSKRDAIRAAELLGAALERRELNSNPIERVDAEAYQIWIETVRSVLDQETYEKAMSRGRGIAIEAAARMALEDWD
jgi:tetratricopeptide (TPR) repeat protein